MVYRTSQSVMVIWMVAENMRPLGKRTGFQYSQHWCTQSINMFLSVPQAPLLPPELSEEGQIIAAQCALLHSRGTMRRF